MLLRLVFAALGLLQSPAEAATCLRYGATLTLTGIYRPAIIVAARDGLDPQRLRAITSDLLDLDTPFCIDSDVVSSGILAVTNVQLLCPGLTSEAGHAISLTGRLLGAHTGNGHTPVLLVCTNAR